MSRLQPIALFVALAAGPALTAALLPEQTQRTDPRPSAAAAPEVTADALRDFCRGQIATNKIPRYIRFTSEFPTTVTGKIQKFKMREISIAELGLGVAETVKTA